MKTIEIKTSCRSEMINITAQIKNIIKESGIKDGICVLYVPHTTAGVTINECADPDVVCDMTSFLNSLIPQMSSFRHGEGNSDAHIKASLIGFSQHLIIDGGKPELGTWQGIFFFEFDGPRTRKLHVKIIKN